jgi:hypothetical protein
MTKTRQPCRCEPSPPRKHRPCAACVAWEAGKVLLANGQRMPKTQWVQEHEAPHHDKEMAQAKKVRA